ncbi:MAG: hypothetical protein WEB33_05885 [Bacteroidota bacterium]
MGFIFESEIVAIMNTVRARTIGEEDGVKMKNVLAADVHPAIKAYFKAEVERLLQQERAKEARSKRFPYGLPEVQGLQRQIDLLLVHQYEFDRQEFESILDESVHFQFNYLCRPRWTLQEFLFERRRTAGIGEILRKLRYCVEYRYLAEVFKRYVTDRGLAELGYEEFRTLIEKIDSEVVARHSTGELAQVLKPLVDFIELGIPGTRVSDTGPVLPIDAAIVFFEDKKMDEIRAFLEKARDKNNVAEVSIADLANLIREARGEASTEGVKEEDVAAIPPVETIPPPKELENKTPPAELPGEVPQNGEGSRKKGGRPEIADIYSLFNLKEQKLFVRRLFKKDEVEFRNALDRLNATVTWNQASLILDEVFSAQNVDPFSKEAVLFTDKIFARYASRERQGT